MRRPVMRWIEGHLAGHERFAAGLHGVGNESDSRSRPDQIVEEVVRGLPDRRDHAKSGHDHPAAGHCRGSAGAGGSAMSRSTTDASSRGGRTSVTSFGGKGAPPASSSSKKNSRYPSESMAMVWSGGCG